MNEVEKKRLLKIRKKIDKNRPNFKRFESWRYVRIKDQWRKPKGIDNHMRTEEKGWPKSVKIGYRGPASVRGLHASGYEEVMVWKKGDLEHIDPKTQVARIGGSVGKRKRETILEKAKVLTVHILNPGVREIEDEFEDLVDEDYDDEEDFENEGNYDEVIDSEEEEE